MDIVILLYEGFTSLDVIGPYETLCRLPGASVKFVAREKGAVESDYKHAKLIADYSISEISRADILLIPGSTISFLQAIEDKALMTWISKVHHTTKWTLAVCSGAVILAATGVLKGLPATTHWAVYDQLEKLGAKPVAERFVRNGKIITAAGVSAGIDAALYLASLECGEETAQMLQLILEYDPNPPFEAGAVAKAPAHLVAKAKRALVRDIKRMAGGTVFSLFKTIVKLKLINTVAYRNNFKL